jgi:Uma2 family endonuclease
MSTLLEQSSKPASLRDIAVVSEQLAADLSQLHLSSEGFSEADYLSLDGPYFVEYLHGKLQVLPMPTHLHQFLQLFLGAAVKNWVGKTRVAGSPMHRFAISPFRVRLSEKHYREPDVGVMLRDNVSRCFKDHWDGADFVIEILSPSNREHDTQTKRQEYAAAGIGEYWIIDPDARSLVQLVLQNDQYLEAALLVGTGEVTSAVLQGFSIDLAVMFADAADHEVS